MIYVDNDNCNNCPHNEIGKYFCDIRQYTIENACWTYCINHPFYNKANITTPLGPMYSFSREHTNRTVILKAPDSQNIKDIVLAKAKEIKEVNDYHYIELQRDIVIVLTLGVYKDERAIELLKHIQRFKVEIKVTPPVEGCSWSRKQLIQAATQSLTKITEPEKQLTPEQRRFSWLCGEDESHNEMV